ncbi:MAG TPA: YceI family protein [Chloroflexaceae bacterium]|nr:YceI family protein [Chloroflexaceae bacterium]
MFKRLIVVGGLAVAVVLALAAIFVFRPPEAASSPIEAIPIATAVPTAAAAQEPVATAAPTAAVQASAATASPATTEPAATEPAAASAGPRLFEIVPAESQARFLIDEVLRGSPITVVGATDQVAGQIAIDPTDPASAQVGPILINARTLATDNDMRNRAIRNFILDTNSHEFVTFTPTALSGLPETVAVGQPFSFQLSGDLTVRATTQPVIFDVTVTPVSEDELVGSATTQILYRDFGLSIPDSPSVDTVADEVVLELDFVAQAIAG